VKWFLIENKKQAKLDLELLLAVVPLNEILEIKSLNQEQYSDFKLSFLAKTHHDS